MATARAFGEAFKRRRRELGLTLREFCRRTGLDPGNVSKLERGRMAPPADPAKLEEYADHLELPADSGERREFVQLGAVCAGRIPEEVLADEELVKKLPLVFRTCTGRKMTAKQLASLAEKIRKA